MTRWGHRFVSSLGLANLWLLFVWTGLITYSAADEYLSEVRPGATHYAAGLLAMLLLASAFLLIRRLAERPSRYQRLIRWGFLMMLLVPLNAIRDVLSLSHPALKGQMLKVMPLWSAAALLSVLLASWALAAWRWTDRLYSLVDDHLIFLSPALLVIATGLVRATLNPSPPPVDQASRPLLSTPAASSGRVVWLVLDEFDQRLSLEERPKELALPELDALRQSSVWATEAYPPSNATLTSIPSLLLGKTVEAARAVGPASLLIRYPGARETLDWASQPTIFNEMAAHQWNSALVGWYHPYCRMFGSQVSACEWSVLPNRANSHGDTIAEIVPSMLRSLFETTMFSPFSQSHSTQQHAANILRLNATASHLVASPQYQFVFLHLQGAHAPFPFDRRTGQMTRANQSIRGYLDGLALADWTIGHLRQSLRDSGLDATTHLIVSSDHAYRSGGAFDGKPCTRIPFLVHLAGQTTSTPVTNRFESVATRDLVLKLLTGAIQTPAQVADWMHHPTTPQPESSHAQLPTAAH
jgi:hypothetical protein